MSSSFQLSERFWSLARQLIPNLPSHTLSGADVLASDPAVFALSSSCCGLDVSGKRWMPPGLARARPPIAGFRSGSGPGCSSGCGGWRPSDTMRCMGLTGAGLRTLTLPGRGRPDSAPTILAGVGAFAPEDSYGLGDYDHADLPDGLTLAPDDWDEPYLRLTGDTQASQITSLWRACARVWRQTVEFLGSGT